MLSDEIKYCEARFKNEMQIDYFRMEIENVEFLIEKIKKFSDFALQLTKLELQSEKGQAKAKELLVEMHRVIDSIAYKKSTLYTRN